MQIIQQVLTVSASLVAETRSVSPDAPTEFLVPYFEADTIFAPLKDVAWFPELRSMSFAYGHSSTIAFDVETKCVFDLFTLGGTVRKEWVNSSLDAYIRCVTRFLEGAPYEIWGPNWEIIDGVSDTIISALNSIDPGCADDGRFWNERAWDAANGDWAAETFDRREG